MTAGTEGVPIGRGRSAWWLRLAIFVVVALGVAMVAATNAFLTERYTESTRNRAELRLALYQGNLLAELRKSQIVPLLLSRDQALIEALASSDFAATSRRLISYEDDLGVEGLTLMDVDGRVVAATDRFRLGARYRGEAAFIDALRSPDTVFATSGAAGPFPFTYSRRIFRGRELMGVIAVAVDLRQFETRWAGISDAVFVADSEGRILLSTEGRWRGRTEAEALAVAPAPSVIRQALRSAYDWTTLPVDAYFDGDTVMRSETRIPFQGWRLTSFTAYTSVREKVNGVLALQITGLAILLAVLSWFSLRKVGRRLRIFQRESAELRSLNAALSREIAERERAEENLSAAEATLQQSSKLAVLGEMSAAVSHELNQPLAAMRTYLAGAKLLLQRNRPVEALSSFQRIDDLIERMGAITRQLKSYARKGGEALAPVDMRDALSGALTMMEPQLRSRDVTVARQLPDQPVMVLADRLRLEQVIINLLRNALDAAKGQADPRVDLLIAAGEDAVLTVRDNGTGIADLDSLFEPFYTTKRPGDGVGLGLAISSGIVTDLGGRLSARNARIGGAVFEVRLPLLRPEGRAATMDDIADGPAHAEPTATAAE